MAAASLQSMQDGSPPLPRPLLNPARSTKSSSSSAAKPRTAFSSVWRAPSQIDLFDPNSFSKLNEGCRPVNRLLESMTKNVRLAFINKNSKLWGIEPEPTRSTVSVEMEFSDPLLHLGSLRATTSSWCARSTLSSSITIPGAHDANAGGERSWPSSTWAPGSTTRSRQRIAEPSGIRGALQRGWIQRRC